MPKPEVKVELKPNVADEVVVEGHESLEKEARSVEVEIEAKPKEKVEPKYVTVEELQKIQKQFDGISKTIRHAKDIPALSAQIEELKQTIASNRTLTPSQKADARDEIDEMLEKNPNDWRTPVERLAEKKFKSLMDERDRQYQTLQQHNQKLSIL